MTLNPTEKPIECPEHDDVASRQHERFLEQLLVSACPALPSAEPYGLLPEPSRDEATQQVPCSFSNRLAMLVCSAVTLLLLAMNVAAYVLFVFPDSDKAEEASVAEAVPDVFLLGEIDDIAYTPGTVEELIEFSFGWEGGFSLSPGGGSTRYPKKTECMRSPSTSRQSRRLCPTDPKTRLTVFKFLWRKLGISMPSKPLD